MVMIKIKNVDSDKHFNSNFNTSVKILYENNINSRIINNKDKNVISLTSSLI